jgi:hypothetical protein
MLAIIMIFWGVSLGVAVRDRTDVPVPTPTPEAYVIEVDKR